MHNTLYEEALRDIYANQDKHIVPSNAVSYNITEAIALWNDEDSTTLQEEDWPNLIDKTMSLISDHFSKTQGESFLPYKNNFAATGAFAQNVKTHAKTSAKTPDVKVIMSSFCDYIAILSQHSLETQQIYFNAFPPKAAAEIACSGGTKSRIEVLKKYLSCNPTEAPLITANQGEVERIVGELVEFLPSSLEVHITTFTKYGLGVVPPEKAKMDDQYYLSPKAYIPVEKMWNFLTGYNDKMQVRVDREIRDQVDDQTAEIFQVIKEINDPEQFMSDLESKDENIKKTSEKLRDQLSALMKPYKKDWLMLMKEIEVDGEEGFGWKTKEEIKKDLYDQHPTNSILKDKKLDMEIRDIVYQQASKISQVIEEINDPQQFMSDLASKDENVKKTSEKLRDQLSALMKPYKKDWQYLTTKKEVSGEEVEVWKTKPEIIKNLYGSFQTEAFKATKRSDVVIAADISENINALSYANVLFSEKAKDHFLPLLQSNSVSDRVFAVEALWVMSENFLGSTPGTFVPLLESLMIKEDHEKTVSNITQSLDVISTFIPEQFRHKVERINDRYNHYKSNPGITAYIEDSTNATLSSHIRYGATAEKIINRIATNPQDLVVLNEKDAKKLMFHPCREEIFKQINSEEVKDSLRLANSTIQNSFIQEAIYFGIKCNYEKIVEDCLGNYVTDDNKDKILNCNNKVKPIINAAHKNQVNIIKALLKAGASPDEKNHNSSTPIMIAAQNGNLEAIEALREAGANHSLENFQGFTAMIIAAGKGHTEAITLNSRNIHPL